MATNFNLELTPTQSLIKRVILFDYLLINFDLFAIYKGTYCKRFKNSYKIYLEPELKIKPNNFDKWRRRWSIAVWFLAANFSVRFSSICLIQLAKYQATSYVFVESTSATTSTGELLAVTVDTRLTLALKRYKLYYIFDNILSDIPGMSMAIHLVLLISIAYVVIFMTYHYRIKPMDAIDLRIMMKPQRERTRIDLLIRQQIESHMNQVFAPDEIANSKSVQTQRAELSPKCLAQREWVIAERGGRAGFVFDPALRPVRYSADYPEQAWRAIVRTSINVALTALIFGGFVESYLIGWSLDLKCRSKGLNQQCSFPADFTWFEIYSLFELLLAMNTYGLMFSVAAVSILSHLRSQLVIIEEMKSDLNNLLNALKLIHCRRYLSFHHIGLMMEISRHEPHLSDALLKTLIKSRINLGELRAQADFITEQVSSFMIFFGSSLVFSLTLVKMEGPYMEDFRNNLIRFLWIAPNPMLFLCARQYSKASKLQIIGDSILAQLHSADGSSYQTLFGSTFGQDLLVSWHKFIEFDSLSDLRNSIRPFGLNLSFKQIFQINFYVTSLAALVFK